VKEKRLHCSTDIDLLQLAYQENHVLVTHDSDSGKIVYTQPVNFVGIVYVSYGHILAGFHISTLRTLLQHNPEVDLPFIIVAKNASTTVKIRIRKLKI
jgi:hypothetical protein